MRSIELTPTANCIAIKVSRQSRQSQPSGDKSVSTNSNLDCHNFAWSIVCPHRFLKVFWPLGNAVGSAAFALGLSRRNAVRHRRRRDVSGDRLIRVAGPAVGGDHCDGRNGRRRADPPHPRRVDPPIATIALRWMGLRTLRYPPRSTDQT